MNNLLNLPNWTTTDQKYLFHVKPWWDKYLTKLLKKQNTWLRKFNQNPQLYFVKGTNYDLEDLAILFKNSHRYFEFYQQKMRQILNQPRVYRKFQKWTLQVGSLAGFLNGLKTLTTFYAYLAEEAVPQKRMALLKMVNGQMTTLWKRYQREALSLIPEDYKDYFQKLFAQVSQDSQTLFNPSLVLNQALKDLQKLSQKQKISPQLETNFQVMTLLFGGFTNAFLQFQARCLASLHDF
ncbi:hypothetical protein JN01_0588 [Entomoplasma freundtii]|uniref:Uncharacterized protein n=1 Tax=Entomoplasma freundtii TaxID=74700 RepID=A0A2K8NUD1_9MOLU|nr:hypothetical protein [Entomoplasma freundtii]ATZ16371.1 hypothetical protein EFREU_v1c03450 [Entomoplasma freundtii]TDY56590.1 hypothetical protein JN01_0588 [Entomoplasma freundtii]